MNGWMRSLKLSKLKPKNQRDDLIVSVILGLVIGAMAALLQKLTGADTVGTLVVGVVVATIVAGMVVAEGENRDRRL